jgi:hypothetical protein
MVFAPCVQETPRQSITKKLLPASRRKKRESPALKEVVRGSLLVPSRDKRVEGQQNALKSQKSEFKILTMF